MRLVLLLLVAVAGGGCAHPQQPEAAPAPAAATDEVQVRACQSCRHDLELCRERTTSPGAGAVSGAAPSECMDQFMSCLQQQQLDSVRCSGVN